MAEVNEQSEKKIISEIIRKKLQKVFGHPFY